MGTPSGGLASRAWSSTSGHHGGMMRTHLPHLLLVLQLGDPSVEPQLHGGHGHGLQLVDVVELLLRKTTQHHHRETPSPVLSVKGGRGATEPCSAQPARGATRTRLHGVACLPACLPLSARHHDMQVVTVCRLLTLILRKLWGRSFWMPGTSQAATTTSKLRLSPSTTVSPLPAPTTNHPTSPREG